MVKTLYDWTAKRAGGRITIEHSTGKVVGIEHIYVKEGRIVAERCDGEFYVLAYQSPPAPKPDNFGPELFAALKSQC